VAVPIDPVPVDPAPVDPVTIDLVQLDAELPLPAYAHTGDAGLDLYARDDATVAAGGGRALVATGIAIAIPMGWCGLVMPRSGLAVRHGISIVNAPGLIDAAYRGEIKVVLLNTDPEHDYEVHRGDRIAQLVLQRVGAVAWNVVSELGGADRGGGFGHSGR
jgi:dUTP pyrophosphatase